MHKIRDNSGFTTLEMLLVLVIVAIVSFTGWSVYNARNNTNELNNSSANTQVAVKTSGCSFSLSLGQQNGAAGTFHQDLIFTNNGAKTCSLNGYPKVTLTDASGTLIGQPAANDTSMTATAVSIAAKGTAHATLSFPDPGITGNTCNATKSTYIYVTPPGSATVLKVAGVQQYCANFMVAPVESGE